MKALSGKQTKLALAAVAMTASMGAQAVPMSNPAIGGGVGGLPCTTYTGGPLLVAGACTAANIASALGGNGNVELGKFASSPATTLSGDFAGTPVVLSGLVLADWTANSNWLTQQYITGAATSIGATLNLAQLAAATTAFLTLDILSGPGVMNPYQMVSDPNVSDVNLIGGSVVVGLDGLLNATSILQAMFPALTVPAGAQASEVVKVSYQGNTSYLYGFSATPTGYATQDGSYSGRYTVPIPATLWLMGIGLAALVAGRRR